MASELSLVATRAQAAAKAAVIEEEEFDTRDPKEITLTANESALLEAVQNFANSAGTIVQVFTSCLGSDPNLWNGYNPALKNIKPALIEYWIEKIWRCNKKEAAKVLKCDENAVVEQMKKEIRVPNSKVEEAKNRDLWLLRNKIKRNVNLFCNKNVYQQAKELKKLSEHMIGASVVGVAESGEEISMPSGTDAAGFFASDRLRLVESTSFPVDESNGKMTVWLHTATSKAKSEKKAFGCQEFVVVYLPVASTSAQDWNLSKTVQVCVPAPGVRILPDFEYTQQVVLTSSLIPMPAARLFLSMRLSGKQRKGGSHTPGQMLAVRAIVACYEFNKFRHYEYQLEQVRNKPPPSQRLQPHSKEWAMSILEDDEFGCVKFVEEVDLIPSLPLGTFLWLQHDGKLHAGLTYQRTLTSDTDLILLPADEKRAPVIAASSAAAKAAVHTAIAAEPSTAESETGAGAGDNQAADETTAPVAHATAEEPFAAAFCASLNLANLVLGESIHVINLDLFPLPKAMEEKLLRGLSEKLFPGETFDLEQIDDLLTQIAAEEDHDFAVVDGNYIGRLRTHLHKDPFNHLRLIRFSASNPIGTFKGPTGKGKDASVKVSSYWLKSWAGPAVTPSPVPAANALIDFETPLSSIRENGWFNFGGIMILDLSKIASNEDGLKTRGLFLDDAAPLVRCQFVCGSSVAWSMSFTVIVLDSWALKNPEECELSLLPQNYFSGALVVGDRLMELGTDNACVVTSIACKAPTQAQGVVENEWTFVVAWDNPEKKSSEYELGVDLEAKFVLVSHLDNSLWDEISEPLASKPKKKNRRRVSKKNQEITPSPTPAPEKTTRRLAGRDLAAAKPGSDNEQVCHRLLLQTNQLFLASEKIKKGNKQESEQKLSGIALIKDIQSKFGIADSELAKELALFASTPNKGAELTNVSRPQPAAVNPRKLKLSPLHVGVLEENSLVNWANRVSYTRAGNDILAYHPLLQHTNKGWKKFTPGYFSEFLVSIVGQDRPVIGWLACVQEDFKLQKYDDVKFRDLIYDCIQIMPAEYQVHLNFYLKNSSLRYTFQRILLRVSLVSPCPISFKLITNALFGRFALACRNSDEREALPQIRTFRALCEYFIFGLNSRFFCGIYGISQEDLRRTVHWLGWNLTVKEAEVFGWFFDPKRLPSSASEYSVAGTTVLTLADLPPFWESTPEEFGYLQRVCEKWVTFNVPDDSPFLESTPEFKQAFFYLVLTSTHFVEDAVKIHAPFSDISELKKFVTAFKWYSSTAVAALVEERAAFVESYFRFHPHSDDWLVLAQNWTLITSASNWAGDKREASDLCESIVNNPTACDDSFWTFCDTMNAPLRVKLLQLFLDVTDQELSFRVLVVKYKRPIDVFERVLHFLKSFRPQDTDWDNAPFDLKRQGNPAVEEFQLPAFDEQGSNESGEDEEGSGALDEAVGKNDSVSSSSSEGSKSDDDSEESADENAEEDTGFSEDSAGEDAQEETGSKEDEPTQDVVPKAKTGNQEEEEGIVLDQVRDAGQVVTSPQETSEGKGVTLVDEQAACKNVTENDADRAAELNEEPKAKKQRGKGVRKEALPPEKPPSDSDEVSDKKRKGANGNDSGESTMANPTQKLSGKRQHSERNRQLAEKKNAKSPPASPQKTSTPALLLRKDSTPKKGDAASSPAKTQPAAVNKRVIPLKPGRTPPSKK